MSRPLIYDITRLATRLFNTTPNGIDRVDGAFAQHFLAEGGGHRSGVLTTPVLTRVLRPAAARSVIDSVHDHWGEDETPEEDPHYRHVADVLAGRPEVSMARVTRGRDGASRRALNWFTHNKWSRGFSPDEFLRDGGVYLNVSQFPLWIEGCFRWLGERQDIKGVFFLHDLLPLQAPEYFRPQEFRIHQARLRTLARYGAAAIVSTEVVAADLRRRLADLGRSDFAIHVAPLPVAPVFRAPESEESIRDLAGHPYFIQCSTIEPRKNHLLVLHIWRDLVERLGAAAPKLVLVGRRGWENENVVDLLERCSGLQRHVIEVSGLSTPSVNRLMRGARALLMPSFAEGFGLPVAEALAAGVPVICSDIPVFREIGGQAVDAIDPIDGAAWREAILAYAEEPSKRRAVACARAKAHISPDFPAYFAGVDQFLDGL